MVVGSGGWSEERSEWMGGGVRMGMYVYVCMCVCESACVRVRV